MSRIGKVSLVGAGPGEPELLTVRGSRLLETADLIVHDRLIDERLLAMAGADAVLVDVGKVPGDSGSRQSDINDLLVDEARQGKRVVRLKGGDPYVFGRGGEEAEVLAAAGIPFEVIPGVTSAVAAPAYAGIPLTHRDYASSFTVVTGSLAGDGEGSSPDWPTLAKTPGTLVILMGWRSLSHIAETLIEHGKPSETPSAVVSWGSEPWQKTVTGTLGSIADTAKSRGMTAPATVVIGEVVRLGQRLNWFESLPLLGRRVLVTRTRNQAGVLSRHLSELGAVPVEIPTVEIRPPEDFSGIDSALACAAGFDWIVFTSANAVSSVHSRLKAAGLDARALQGVRISSIGPATAQAVERIGILSDLVPGTATSKGLAEALSSRIGIGARVLLPRADIATRELPEMLNDLGASVTEVTAYRTVIPDESRKRAEEAIRAGVDVAIFTSSSTVRNLLRLLDDGPESLSGIKVACIGPITASTAGRLRLKVDIVSKSPTISGLARALVQYFEERK